MKKTRDINDFYASDDAEQGGEVFFVSCDRHDKDRIEVQFGFDGLVESKERYFNFDINFLFFSPKTLGLLDSESGDSTRRHMESVEATRSEFQSYFRLHSYVSNPNSEFSVDRVLERLDSLKEDTDVRHLRLFAVEVDGYLKGQTRKVRNHLSLYKKQAFSLEGAQADLEEVRQVIHRFRAITEVCEEFADENSKLFKEFELLNEYVSHLYVKFLGVIDHKLKDLDATHSLRLAAIEMGKEEAEFRTHKNFLVGDVDSTWHHDRKEDLYLRRISSLKKYFHRALFIQVSSKTLERKLFVPVYAISAALAAAWAIMIQLYTAKSFMAGVEINILAFVSIGVLAYVAKDIMKDFFRRFFYSSGRRWAPDFERRLYSKTPKKVTKEVGVIKEYLRFSETSKLSEELKRQRYSVEGGEVEQALGEDVLHFKKKVSLDLTELDYDDQFPWGMREILRFRLDRLSASMEDAKKRLPIVFSNGLVEQRMGRRLYHTYVVAQIQAKGKGADDLMSLVRAYRITLDKNGIIGSKEIDWELPIGLVEKLS